MLEIPKKTTEMIENSIEDMLRCGTKSISRSTSRAAGEEKMFSIINSSAGSKIIFSNAILEKLDNPIQLQITYDKIKKTIMVGEHLLGNENSYTIRKSGSKGIIYNKGLVVEITAALKLNFSHMTSLTFQDVGYGSCKQYPVAIIKVM
jgi:hypothetical protein